MFIVDKNLNFLLIHSLFYGCWHDGHATHGGGMEASNCPLFVASIRMIETATNCEDIMLAMGIFDEVITANFNDSSTNNIKSSDWKKLTSIIDHLLNDTERYTVSPWPFIYQSFDLFLAKQNTVKVHKDLYKEYKVDKSFVEAIMRAIKKSECEWTEPDEFDDEDTNEYDDDEIAIEAPSQTFSNEYGDILHAFGTISCNAYNKDHNQGVYKWKFKLNKYGGMKIGVWNKSSQPHTTDGDFTNGGTEGYAYDRESNLFKERNYGVDLKTGDIVDMILDLRGSDTKSLSFKINNIDYGIAYRNIKGGEYRMAVSLYKGDSITILNPEINWINHKSD